MYGFLANIVCILDYLESIYSRITVTIFHGKCHLIPCILKIMTEIFYSKNIEIQFRKMYIHFKEGMVTKYEELEKNNGRSSVLAAMVSSVVAPVWAAEDD